MPAPQDLHVDRFLTNISVDFIQDSANFVADKVFPVVPVQKQSDKYVIYERGSFWRDQVHTRPLGGRLDVADWELDEGVYFCEERGLARKIDDRERANTDDPIQQDRQTVRLLTEAMAINNDRRWASAYFQPGVWTTDLDGSGSDFVQFDNENSNPITTFDAQKESMLELTGRMPNTLVVGQAVHRELRNNPEILDRIKWTHTGMTNGRITNQLLAGLFEVDQYLVARATHNAAAEGLADDFEFILDSKAALLAYVPPSAGLNVPASGYIFAWTGLMPGVTNAMGAVIQRGRDDFAHSDHFEIRSATDMRLVSPDLGIFFENAVA